MKGFSIIFIGKILRRSQPLSLPYGVGRILFTGLENVFERTAVLSRASIAEQLGGYRWRSQQDWPARG
jgi:hypothetical protein